MRISVAVFAHNEARRILRCLDSLRAAAEGISLDVIVLANGCRDHTAAVARAWVPGPDADISVRVAEIARGDKANAWNEFVHRLSGPADHYVFCDGDCYAEPRAINHLVDALAHDPHAQAASALPVTGRSVAMAREAMARQRDLAGNLYALRGEFVQRIRRAGIRLPIGLVGDDSLVGAFAKFDLLPVPGRWDDTRIYPVPQAGFGFDSMNPLSRTDIRTYWRRRVRYSVRRYQFIALREVFLAGGFTAMPSRIEDLAGALPAAARLTWRGGDTLFDWLARRRIRAESAWSGRG
jgi:glycosyltransferase involved in cell wall biosynthesis